VVSAFFNIRDPLSAVDMHQRMMVNRNTSFIKTGKEESYNEL
jgi:hypothetical protein